MSQQRENAILDLNYEGGDISVEFDLVAYHIPDLNIHIQMYCHDAGG